MRLTENLNPCSLCPKKCGIDRTRQTGFCGCGNGIKAARAALHHWEEPCISGTRGSGTVFFSGCNLRCRFCQNYNISTEGFGKEIPPERLAEIFIELQEKGAHNINLVTATPYLPWVIQALDIVKPSLCIPVVYNCGGYENPDVIKCLKGYIDIFLPDLKFFEKRLSEEYAGAADYFDAASEAVIEMISQTGAPVFDEDGILKSGVIIRHLVLPGCRKDSFALLNWISGNLPKEKFLLSLMRQYTPTVNTRNHPVLNRRVTTFEYDSVVNEALRLGLAQGFMQEKSSAKEEYTPPFDLTGL